MVTEMVVETLHPIEKRVLMAFKGNELQSVPELMENTGLSEVEVMRGIQWLRGKELVSTKAEEMCLGDSEKRNTDDSTTLPMTAPHAASRLGACCPSGPTNPPSLLDDHPGGSECHPSAEARPRPSPQRRRRGAGAGEREAHWLPAERRRPPWSEASPEWRARQARREAGGPAPGRRPRPRPRQRHPPRPRQAPRLQQGCARRATS